MLTNKPRFLVDIEFADGGGNGRLTETFTMLAP